MFSFYPSSRPQSYHQPSPYYQPSPYARALAQQQERQRALAAQQERQRALAQEMERQRAARSRYFPGGYDYEPDSDEEDYYLTPRQRALLEARRRQDAVELRKQQLYEQQQARAAEEQSVSTTLADLNIDPAAHVRSECQHTPAAPVRATDTPSAPPAPPVSAPPSPELLNEAATKIQTQYRIHRSLRAISALASKFDALKASFVPPTTIDFQGDDGIVSVPARSTSVQPPAESAKLAFTPTNVPLHTYNEHLSRLLVALDAVESRGDRGVRERRREVVRAIEGEAARVESFWRSAWATYQHQQQQTEEQEVCAMVVDEESGVAPLPELATPESDSDVIRVAPLPELAESESDSDVDPELPTPPATPAESPKLVLSPESESAEEDGVVVNSAEDEKVSGEDFVLV
ncbi:hypothetical protein B0H17DRAFT_1045889 [Mycena rosella]|uniref:BAG domain-containing protein n=1 Tax=Mycena rosella TaxID=1033263 RepID=A0AAD7DZ34_MYCRO|nr:hypothetical protein B0H17DRAFT_1045889 [Mycena rosella]